MSQCKLLESLVGAVHVYGDASARPWAALKTKMSVRLRELI